MNDKFMKKIEKLAPPGWDVKRELIIDALLIVFFLFWFWLAFYIHFNNMVWEPEVYYWNYPVGHPISSPILYRPLIYVMRNTLTVLAVIAVKAAASVCSHYRYFRSGSMSIYTMKRTAKRSELHRRCLLIPGCLLVITALLTFINVKIGMSLYYANIPKGGIPDPAFDVPFTFWRMIICI